MDISYIGTRDKLFNFSTGGLQVYVVITWSEKAGSYEAAVFFDNVRMLTAQTTRQLYSDDAMQLIEVAAGEPNARLPRGVTLKFAKINQS